MTETKKHLMGIFQGTSESDIDKMIEDNYKFFEYIKSPSKKAQAIASTI